MTTADKNLVRRRSDGNRPLTWEEGDDNLNELIKVIDDQQTFEFAQGVVNQNNTDRFGGIEQDFADHLTVVEAHPQYALATTLAQAQIDLTDHKASTNDVHPQYVTNVAQNQVNGAVDGRLTQLELDVDGAEQAMADHIAAADPHSQYATDTRVDALATDVEKGILPWSSTKTYQGTNVVVHSSSLWIATAQSTGTTPTAGSGLWIKVATLDDGDPINNPNTIMRRDANGRTQVSNPVNDQDATPKTYVDTEITSAVNTAFGGQNGLPLFFVRAWGNFNGSGGVTVRGAGNIASIVRQSAGRYRVNFATAMPDANYGVTLGNAQNTNSAGSVGDAHNAFSFDVNGFTIQTAVSQNFSSDNELVCFQVVR